VSAFSTCKSSGDIIVFSSGKTYNFDNPGATLSSLSGVTITIAGTILFPASTSFKSVSAYMTIQGSNVKVLGGGTIDGNGQAYWNSGITGGPHLIRFDLTGTSTVSSITVQDSPAQHVSVLGSNIVFTNVNIKVTWSRLTSGSLAHNTDGFDVSSATNIQIINSVIDNYDDCVAINGGVTNLYISGMTCSNGHGVSVGSLGSSNKNDVVNGIYVTGSTFNNTQHGARIKTYLVDSGNTGYAQNITFHSNKYYGGSSSEEPICITQKYCNNGSCGSGTVGFDLKGATFSDLEFFSFGTKYDIVSIYCESTSNCGQWTFSGTTIPSGGVVGCHDVGSSQIAGLACSQTISTACN